MKKSKSKPKIPASKEKKPQTSPTPQTPLQQKINAIVLQANEAGISSFVFVFKDPGSGVMTTHFQNISLADAVNASGFSWIQAINTELKNHPEYSADYAAIFADAVKQFLEITKTINEKVAEYRKKK